MSIVTTVILVMGYDYQGKHLAKVHEFSSTSIGLPISDSAMKQLDHCDDFGGYKCAEVDVYTGAYNHFDVEGFIKHLDSIEWSTHAAVTIYTSSPVNHMWTWRNNYKEEY